MPLSGNFSFFFFLIYFLSLLSFRMRMVDDLYPRGSMIVIYIFARSVTHASIDGKMFDSIVAAR